jgi:eukaryotic-like serine/threonine-protein kinase
MLGGRYKLLNELGSGGMAVVWRARDEVLGRTVAVKLLAGRYADDPQSRARIREEARAAATLSPHAHIAQVYDFGESDDDGSPRPYVVMELVNGPTLQQRAAAGPLPPRTVFRICGEVASALAAAHLDGLVHRDIKPANVMVTTGGAKVVDFGIAAAAGSGEPEDVLIGTPAYLAPERLTGGSVVPATDVYALGVLLYRLLANESPWSVDTTTQMLTAHVYVDPAPLPALPGVPPAVTDLVGRCLRKDPAERPTAAEACAVLADAAEASQTGVRRENVPLPGAFGQVAGEVGRLNAGPASNAAADRRSSRRAQAPERPAIANAASGRGGSAGVASGPAAAEGDARRPVTQDAESSSPDAGSRPGSAVAVAPPEPVPSVRVPAPRSPGPTGPSDRGAAVPDRGQRKRRALLIGGGVAAAIVAALLVWLLVPVNATGGRNGADHGTDAAAPPPLVVAGQATPPPGATDVGGRPGAAPGANGGVAVVGGDAGQRESPARPGAPGTNGGGVVAGPGRTTDPAAPPSAGPSASSRAPASSAPAGGKTKKLSSAGGTVKASCTGGKARLESWTPKSHYAVEQVNPGPVLAATIVFKSATTRIRMTVTCVAGEPTTVNLPL